MTTSMKEPPTALLTPRGQDSGPLPDIPLYPRASVGNHADELTPWIPPLATHFLASRYLSIPCCAWSLDARFDPARDVPLCAVDAETLNLGSGGEGAAGSSYALYRVWLAAPSVHCGWAVEVEMLQIPSTRNWAIVGELGALFFLSTLWFELISGNRPSTRRLFGRRRAQCRRAYRRCA
jgi:hypothetical protein